MSILVPVSWGELLDKITILEIKSERLRDPRQRANVDKELRALRQVRDAEWPRGTALDGETAELRAVNEALWEIEDRIRLCEREQRFDSEFVALARSVYKQNDLRAHLKRRINVKLNSDLNEEKSYETYQ